MPLHVSSTCAHHQEVKCVRQYWRPDDVHMCSKHVEAWNKLTVKHKFCASIRLITEINISPTVPFWPRPKQQAVLWIYFTLYTTLSPEDEHYACWIVLILTGDRVGMYIGGIKDRRSTVITWAFATKERRIVDGKKKIINPHRGRVASSHNVEIPNIHVDYAACYD